MRIAIIAAMEVEKNYIHSKLTKPVEIPTKTFSYYVGDFYGHEIALLQSGIGKVNAALGTQRIIEDFEPDFVINTGVAGGIQRGLEVLDLVVSKDLGYHDADATAFDYQLGQIPQMPAFFTAEEKLVNIAKTYMPEIGKVIEGKIYSGDSFVHREDQIAQIEKNFPDATAIEMEGAAIAHTCFLHKTPFLIIRSISDVVHQNESRKTYENALEKAALASARLTEYIIKELR